MVFRIKRAQELANNPQEKERPESLTNKPNTRQNNRLTSRNDN